MSVLVLGSSGLVGRSLVGRLAAAGEAVVACDVRPSPIPPVAGVTYVHTDISRLDQVLTLVEQHEVSGIVLLSYMMGQLMSLKYADILQACQTNITGVTNVLEAARLLRVPRVVFLSTVGTYGPQAIYGDRPVTEDEILAPTSMYGQMKALNESICDRYAALYDLEVVKIRPSSILGPGSSIWPSRFIDRVALGETGQAPYGESARDNVVAVDDIAALLSRLITGPAPAHRTYLASGHNVTMGELADVVRSVVPGAQIEFPNPKRRPTYAETFDNARAVTEFGWTITGLKETVRAHIDGVRAQAGFPRPASRRERARGPPYRGQAPAIHGAPSRPRGGRAPAVHGRGEFAGAEIRRSEIGLAGQQPPGRPRDADRVHRGSAGRGEPSPPRFPSDARR